MLVPSSRVEQSSVDAPQTQLVKFIFVGAAFFAF